VVEDLVEDLVEDRLVVEEVEVFRFLQGQGQQIKER